MKTIFILTHFFPPKNIVGALRPFRLAKHFNKFRWNPIIITRLPQYKESLDFSLLKELSPGTQIHYIRKSKPLIISEKNSSAAFSKAISLNICNSYPFKYSFIKRIKGTAIDILNKILLPDIDVIFAPFFLKKVISILSEPQKTVIFTTSPTHSIHIVGLILSKIKKVTWIADFRDPWDNYPTTGHYEIKNYLERLLERVVVRKADAVISATEPNMEILIAKHKYLSQSKFFTITNSFDNNKISINNPPDSDKFIISYTGKFYPQKDPFTFFRALRSWFDGMEKEKRRKLLKLLKVQLIGSSNSFVRNYIKDLKLENIIFFIDRVSHNEAIRLTKGSDMVLISTGLGDRTRPGWLPSKLFEYLGCRIPILAIIREGEMANIIRETNSGYVITSEDHQQIHRILEKEIKKKFFNGQLKRNRKFTFEGIEKYEESKVMSDMVNIIERIWEQSHLD